MKNKLGPLSCLLPALGLAVGFGLMMLPHTVKPWEPGWINSHKLALEFGGLFVFAGSVGLGALLALLGLLLTERKGWAGFGLALNLALAGALLWLFSMVAGGFGLGRL